MKNYIILFLILSLISCSNKQRNKDYNYNPKAIEMNNRAVKLSQRFKKDSALLLYDKAIELDENYYLPHANKIDIYLLRNEYQEALYESEMVIKKKPDLAEGWFYSGVINEHQDNIDKAKKYYKKSIEVYKSRMKNSKKGEDITANKLNLALAKKFIGDSSYVNEFEELREIGNYSYLIDSIINKPRKKIINELINNYGN